MSAPDPLQAALDPAQVGNDAWWRMEFFTVDKSGKPADKPAATFDRSMYYANVEAALQSNLDGGAYTITIEGLTDSDYASISTGQDAKPIYARLYLFWNDVVANPASYLTNLVGFPASPAASALVAVLYVSHISRKLGTLTYDTQIQAIEWAVHALNQPLGSPIDAADFAAATGTIHDRTNIEIITHLNGSERLTNSGPEKRMLSTASTYANFLQNVARNVERNRKQFGRGMLLIRDGKVHLGPRSFPLQGDPKTLTVDNGLLQSSIEGASEKDPSAADLDGGGQRIHFNLLMKGRSDIKPGDVVQFSPAQEDQSKTIPGVGQALLGAIAGPLLGAANDSGQLTLAVASVRHRLGKTTGFSTEVTGVTIQDEDHAWDNVANAGSGPRGRNTTPAADPASDAAGAIAEHVAGSLSAWPSLDAAQVRAFNTTSGSDSDPDATRVISQTQQIREGLMPADTNSNAATRLEYDKNFETKYAVPYATPFAWGKCGLVLPRYPGMRILTGHRVGLEDDVVDLGALWEAGTGPDSEAGDYWLVLPVGVADDVRTQIAEDATPTAHDGQVTQDLIDADGNRIIELGSLTVTVGKSKLQSAGARPQSADDADSVTIRHAEGESEIVMLQDGTIRIKGKGITLDAGTGDITLKANKVSVSVTDSMDVS